MIWRKKEKVHIEALDQSITIFEITGYAWNAVKEAIRNDDEIHSAATACAHCVEEFDGMGVNDVMKNVSASAIFEISNAIMDRSKVGKAKNSESAPSDDSSTDSPLN